MTPCRVYRLILLVTSIALGLRAEVPVASVANTAVPAAAPASQAGVLTPEEIQTLSEQLFPFWTHDESVTVEAGWRGNPLLSSYAATGRAFAGGKLEGFLWHLPMGGHWEGGAMLDGEVLRYLDPLPGAGGEQHWFLHGDLRWTPVKSLRVSVSPEIYYFDQVLDLSETAAARYVLPVKVFGARAKLVVRKSFGGRFAIEAGGTAGLARYRAIPENYTEPGGLFRVLWTPDPAWTIEGGVEIKRRSYDDREETTAAGRSLLGTRLHFAERSADLKATRKWTAGGNWEASVKLRAFSNRDEHAGFYDFNLVGASGSLEWTRGKWTLDLDVDANRTHYLVQTVGAGLAPPSRHGRDIDGTFRVERSLGKVWSAYAEVEREGSVTNLENAGYRDLIATLGVKRQL